jgi:hypothetical protein
LAVHLQNGERMGNGRGTEELFRHVRWVGLLWALFPLVGFEIHNWRKMISKYKLCIKPLSP